MKVRACSLGVETTMGVETPAGVEASDGELGSPGVTGVSKVRFSVPSMEFVWEADRDGGKKVTFLVGGDGEPVVVVLGGAKDDVDTILQERARRQAELEADLIKRAAEEELDKLVRLSRSTVQAMEEEAIRNTQQKERDPTREAVVRSLQEATVEMEGHILAMEEAEAQQQKLLVSNTTPLSNGAPSPVSPEIGSSKSPLSSSASLSSLSSLSSNSSASLPPSPPAFTISSYGNCQNTSTKKHNGSPSWDTATKPSSIHAPSTLTAKPPILTPKPNLIHTFTHTPVPHPQSSTQPLVATNTSSSINSQNSPGSSPPSSVSSITSTLSSFTPSPIPSLPSPSSPRAPSPLAIVERDDNEKIQQMPSPSSTVVGVAAQIKRFEQLSEGSLEALKTATLERAKKRRQREILEHLRSQVEAARQQVADATTKQSAEKDDIAWQEQERKAKEAERRIREIARRAREEHRRASYNSPPAHAINRNLNGLTHITLFKNGINGVNGHTGVGGDINGNIKTASEDMSNNNHNHQSNRSSGDGNSGSVLKNGHISGCMRHRLRPPKPPSQASIVAWFREEELPRGAGLEPSHLKIAPWFHGIISRTEAEEVLAGAAVGCFLVRVSERIWGYAISYRAADRCRHYLIDVTGGKYTFFGSHQASHETLSDLVEYHKKEAITTTGGELLTRPCGQPNPRRPDYLDLFSGTHYLTF
ncbi:dual specificity protein kinase splA isoform X2 [Procambarus clarkii]|uniref:dual specificity protein kinase splA isoform X2 n=1 Tax=Procambarus clarkii TaxID=6728 RepID=UPI003743F1E5